MTKEISYRLTGDDDDKALDAAEVKALIAALRANPETANLREAYERVKDRLTPAGRAAYRRELSKLALKRPAIPRRLDDLRDGEYGLAVRGDDCSETRASLRCVDDHRALDLPLCDPDVRFVAEVRRDGAVEQMLVPDIGGELHLQGEVSTREGYLFLDARVSGVVAGRRVRVVLTGIGDVRASRA